MKKNVKYMAIALALFSATLVGCGSDTSDYASAPREGSVVIIPDTGVGASAPTDTSVSGLELFVSPEFNPATNDMDLYFYVKDQDGNRFTLYNKYNFQVRLNGVRIVDNSRETTTLGYLTGVGSHTVALGLDNSGSMASVDSATGLTSMELTKNAAKLYVDRMQGTDKSAVIAFSDEAVIQQAVTTDKLLLKTAIGKLEPTGGTNIGDAITKCVNVLGAYPGKTVAVVMTDGYNTVGDVAVGLDAAEKADLPVFTIGLGPDVDTDTLRAIASLTGGQYFAASTADLNTVFSQTLPDAIEQLQSRSAYRLRFKYPLGRLTWPAAEQVTVMVTLTFENALGTHTAFYETKCLVVGQ